MFCKGIYSAEMSKWIENAGFFDYGIVSENEIIPVSNQATELPNLIHVFSCSTPEQTKILSLVQGQMAM